MLKFKNVEISFDKELANSMYEEKMKKCKFYSCFVALFAIIAVMAIPYFMKSAWCIPVTVLAVFVILFIGLYVSIKMSFSDNDNITLYHWINSLKELEDIYAEVYDGNILLRVINTELSYHSINYFLNIPGLTPDIKDTSNGSKDIQLNVHYSKDTICILIEERQINEN